MHKTVIMHGSDGWYFWLREWKWLLDPIWGNMFRFSGYNDINTIIKTVYILVKCLRKETLRGDIVMDYINMVCSIHHSIHVVSLIFNVTLSGKDEKKWNDEMYINVYSVVFTSTFHSAYIWEINGNVTKYIWVIITW